MFFFFCNLLFFQFHPPTTQFFILFYYSILDFLGNYVFFNTIYDGLYTNLVIFFLILTFNIGFVGSLVFFYGFITISLLRLQIN